MSVLAWVIIGLIAGWLAGLVVKGRGYGILGDIVLGIIGAVVGGFIAGALIGIPDPLTGFTLTTLAIGFVGAVIVVSLVRILSSRLLI